MLVDSSGYVSIVFVYLYCINLCILSVFYLVGKYESWVPAIPSDLQYFRDILMETFLLDNQTFLRTEIHHPILETKLINLIDDISRISLLTVI